MTLPFRKMTLPCLRHIMKKFNVLVVKMEKVTRYWGRVRDWYAIFKKSCTLIALDNQCFMLRVRHIHDNIKKKVGLVY